MDKKYKLKNLTCFNCAGIIERRVNSLDFIESAEVDFDLREIDMIKCCPHTRFFSCELGQPIFLQKIMTTM